MNNPMDVLGSARQYQCLLFDLDGTLVDTADDLYAAMQTLLQQKGKTAIDRKGFRDVVSHGAYAMLEFAFGVKQGQAETETLRREFLALYQQQPAQHSALFAGMWEALSLCHQQGKSWGIITNKPQHLTQPLIKALNFPCAPATVVSGDTTAKPKPSPLPMNKALADTGLEAKQCVYFGDADRDIEAAKHVNMPNVAVSWGYILPSDNIDHWGADCVIQQASQITEWLTKA